MSPADPSQPTVGQPALGGDWMASVRIDGSLIGVARINALTRDTVSMVALDPMIPVGTYVELWLSRGDAEALTLPALMESSGPVSMRARLEMVSQPYLDALELYAATPGEAL